MIGLMSFIQKTKYSQNVLERMGRLGYNAKWTNLERNGRCTMKDMKLLIWLTQLGLSVAVPLGGFILLSVWLRNRFDWGNWVVIVGVVLGVLVAVEGLLSSLKAMKCMAKKEKEETPPVSFNDHE